MDQVNSGVAPRPTTESNLMAEWVAVRVKRDRLLRATDHTQVSDSPLSDAQRAVAADYRQALRDIPQDVGDPFVIEWPEVPAFLK